SNPRNHASASFPAPAIEVAKSIVDSYDRDMPKLELLVTNFVDGLSAAIEAEVIERARKRVAAVLSPRWGRRRTLPEAIALLGIRPRKKPPIQLDRKSTRLNSSHANISYAVFCLK